ncbi:hypothetical protein EDD16DRAFT_1549746 [Pisolithus croceorrhizus]|nr:hypothetical protein EDD16DRAFT_1652056 [Pisolithus croceorrhizus]KAI6128160.1 hypothetical protein EDD16DRAFT_1549746 [Pisolithus croceorrhizus]
MHSGVTCALDNTTRDAEPGLSQVDDALIGLPRSAVQDAGASTNYCPIFRDDGLLASCVHSASYLQETRYANCPTTRCLYPGTEETLCLQEISCATAPSHFASHGIENKSRTEMIRCKWRGCVKNVTRHAFARHIREVHLQHRRGTSAHTSKNYLRATKTNAPGSLGEPIDLAAWPRQ